MDGFFRWLLACAKEVRKVVETNYIIGDEITSSVTSKNQNTTAMVQPALNEADKLKSHETIAGLNAGCPVR